MISKTLKEAYELQKKANYDKALKFMETITVTHNGIFSNPKTLSKLSEAVETMEEIATIAKPLVPSLYEFLSENSKKLNESNYDLNSINSLKETFYRYAALSEFFKELPETLKEGEDLYSAFKNTLGASLLKEDNFEKVAEELSALPEAKLVYFSNVFPDFPLILGTKELKESIDYLTTTSMLNEAVGDDMLLAIQRLKTVLDSLDLFPDVPNTEEFKQTKVGLSNFTNLVKQAAATGRAGVFGANEEKILAQVGTVMSMFTALSTQWDNISGILSDEIKRIEQQGGNFDADTNRNLQNDIKLLRKMIIRRLSSVAGSGGFFSNLMRKFKGKITYPKGLTPQVIADDIVNLIKMSTRNNAPEKQPEQPVASSATPAKVAEPFPKATDESKVVTGMVFESIEDLKNAFSKLGSALKSLQPVAKNAAAKIEQDTKNIPAPATTAATAQPPQQTPQTVATAPAAQASVPSAQAQVAQPATVEPAKPVQPQQVPAENKPEANPAAAATTTPQEKIELVPADFEKLSKNSGAIVGVLQRLKSADPATINKVIKFLQQK